MNPSTNVFLVDPSRLFREGLRRLLEGTAFNVVAESADAREALAQLVTVPALDLLLLDLGAAGEGSAEVLQDIRSLAPTAKIVLLAASVDAVPWPAISGDIDGLLRKDISSAALLRSLELVLLDEKVFPIAAGFLVAGNVEPIAVAERSWADDKTELSLREIQILHHLRRGSPNKVIARELNVAETTVKAHVKAILRKIKAGNRTQAAVWCMTNGLPEPVLLAHDDTVEAA